MRLITEKVPRFVAMNGWGNRILRIDLGNMRIRAQETAQYVPKYLGARGIAARICWEEYPEPVDPFAPASPLMIFPGALTGSRSPYSGRTNVVHLVLRHIRMPGLPALASEAILEGS